LFDLAIKLPLHDEVIISYAFGLAPMDMFIKFNSHNTVYKTFNDKKWVLGMVSRYNNYGSNFELVREGGR
jgi:hypothetical protein